MVRRLCIYLIYDSDKIVDDYIGVALKELKRFSDRLVVVCNFDHIESGKENIANYADEVFYRDNRGYDAGGYQEAITKLITWDRIYDYDELLLTNDSWFGPIYPFDEMFDRMNKTECDFWGITRHMGGKYWFGAEESFPTHIQSYFLNFKYGVLHSSDFKCYWDSYTCSDDRNETIRNFEVGISKSLSNKGYIGKSYMDLHELPFQNEVNVNFYMWHSYELIKDFNMPTLKRTIIDFNIKGFPNALQALEYVKNETNYNYSLISNYIDRINYMGRGKTHYDFESMENFVKSHPRIFIYGHGIWGRRLAVIFDYKGWRFDGYLVTNEVENDAGEDVHCISDIDIKEDDGIIIAQHNKDVCDSILDFISDKISMNNVMTPIYI